MSLKYERRLLTCWAVGGISKARCGIESVANQSQGYIYIYVCIYIIYIIYIICIHI